MHDHRTTEGLLALVHLLDVWAELPTGCRRSARSVVVGHARGQAPRVVPASPHLTRAAHAQLSAEIPVDAQERLPEIGELLGALRTWLDDPDAGQVPAPRGPRIPGHDEHLAEVVA